MDKQISEIKRFWDARAKEFGADWQATLGEKYLRLLEIKTMQKYIRRYNPNRVLDVGCGNGYSTTIYARKFPSIKFIGMDYSFEMIQQAQKDIVPNCSFVLGDVLDATSLELGKFDLIITQRCLQNLPNYDFQHEAINNLLSRTSPNGHLLLMECSKDGVSQFNKMRIMFRKKPLDNLEPWHNYFFMDDRLRSDFNAKIRYFASTYMFLAKVIDSRLSWFGYVLPPIGNFGYDRLYIIK